MPPYPNLICDALLISETIEFLKHCGGRASAISIVGSVMKIDVREPALACTLAEGLVDRDARIRIDESDVVLAANDDGCLDLRNSEFVVIDLETTGAKAPPCKVTEIGAYRVSNGEINAEYHSLINPETEIPPFITSLTGINNEMVADAPTFREVSGELLEFIGGAVLVAHNAHFDVSFLNSEIGQVYLDYRLGNPQLCTVQLSRHILPHIENHKLQTVARHYDIKLENHHRAADDARATAQIFINLLGELNEMGINDLASVRKLGGRRRKWKTA